MTTLKDKSLILLRELIIVGLIVLLAYFANKYVNIWLGKEALEQVKLESHSYEVAVQKSIDEGKPLILEFAALWCSSCRELDKKILAEEQINEKISSDYVFARLDYDTREDKKVFEQFDVQGVPTLIVIDPNTTGARRLSTTSDPEQFILQL